MYRGEEVLESKMELGLDTGKTAVVMTTTETTETDEEFKTNRVILKNQFNFSERAAQTVNYPFRVISGIARDEIE